MKCPNVMWVLGSMDLPFLSFVFRSVFEVYQISRQRPKLKIFKAGSRKLLLNQCFLKKRSIHGS